MSRAVSGAASPRSGHDIPIRDENGRVTAATSRRLFSDEICGSMRTRDAAISSAAASDLATLCGARFAGSMLTREISGERG